MSHEATDSRQRVVVIAAHNEADRIGATLDALGRAFPGSLLVVSDSRSTDATARLAAEAGALVSSAGRTAGRGKGGGMTAATRLALEHSDGGPATTFLFCDGDLGASAAKLPKLAEVVEAGRCDLAIASFARSEGGGFGMALGFARRAIRRLAGLELRAPISGQRAIRGDLVERLLPFASGFGMEIGMTVDAARAGYRVEEVELDLEHRVTGRTPAGFLHRGRQLVDFARVYISRR